MNSHKKYFDFNKKPLLIFWESTKACLLKCGYCRAEAIEEPLPDELTTEKAKKFFRDILDFDRPYPILIITGGDPLIRKDIFELLSYAKKLGISVSLALSATPLLDINTMKKLRKRNVNMVSISLDGGVDKTHDRIRGVKGHFEETINVIKKLMLVGFKVQINTIVLRDNVLELPLIVKLIRDLGITTWEVFFPIRVGRGINIDDLSGYEYEDIMHFLYDVSKYGMQVRTVEAPFFRRVVLWRKMDENKGNNLDSNLLANYRLGTLYRYLHEKLRDLLGNPIDRSLAHTIGTRDGSGVIFVAYNGDVYPSGFAPYPLGNVIKEKISIIYRENNILKKIRRGLFKGKCGYCEYNSICGGSRARALAEKGDILDEDPACIYIPIAKN